MLRSPRSTVCQRSSKCKKTPRVTSAATSPLRRRELRAAHKRRVMIEYALEQAQRRSWRLLVLGSVKCTRATFKLLAACARQPGL